MADPRTPADPRTASGAPGPRTPDPLAPLAALPGVAGHVDAVRAAVDSVYGHRVMRRRSSEVAAEAALRGARASAAVDGADWALEEVRRRTDFGGDPQARTVGAALRATAEVGPLLEVWRRAPLQVLARLHLVAAASGGGAAGRGETAGDAGGGPGAARRAGAAAEGAAEGAAEDRAADAAAAAAGRPRRGAEQPAAPAAGSAETRPEWPPAAPAEEAAARLDALARLLTGGTAAPGLVVAAVVHGELAALRPFGSANGITARAAQRLALVAGGLDPKAVCPAEVGHAELGTAAYAEALRGYASGTPEGMVAWIAHCAEAVRLGVRETVAVCEAMQRGML